ncbi:hypothetical protein ACETU7_11555 [Rhodococcus sp. 3Y1]
MAPEELYGEDLTTGRVDMIVGWSRAGADTATSLASRFSCPSAPSTPATSSAVPAPTPSQTPEPIRTTSVEAPSNLSGLCDPALQGRIDEALSGIGDLGSLIADAEPKLWDLAAVCRSCRAERWSRSGPESRAWSSTGRCRWGYSETLRTG